MKEVIKQERTVEFEITKNSTMKNVIALLKLPYIILAYSVVLYLFWGWFVLTVFEGLPELTLGMSVGLIMISNVFKSRGSVVIKEELKDKDKVNGLLVLPWMLLLVGYILHLVIG